MIGIGDEEMIAVAIDGPAGAGKSFVAKTVAKQLGYIYVDTGAMYRTIGLACDRADIPTDDAEKIAELLKSINISIKYFDDEQHILLDDEDVSGLIRTERVSMLASRVSALPVVRAFLLELQRSFAKSNNVIMDGRDIGTVVLPDADVKIFLTASAEARAKRRVLQLAEKGERADLDTVLADIEKRDHNDSHRDIAPLRAAEDAVIIDTSDIDRDESVSRVINTIKKGIK